MADVKTTQMAEKLAGSFESQAVGFCFLDTDLRYVRINEFLAAANGIPASEHIGKSISEVLPEIAAAGAEAELRQVLKTGAFDIEDGVDQIRVLLASHFSEPLKK